MEEIKTGKFLILSPNQVLQETYDLIQGLQVASKLMSDHYTNYIKVEGQLPRDKKRILEEIVSAMKRDETSFRDVYIGTE